jgi:hypothetical protein
MNKFIISLFLIIILSSCQSTKDALTLKKRNNADEFLVEKKSPLVLPPEYDKLPSPEVLSTDTANFGSAEDTIESLIGSKKTKISNRNKKKSNNPNIEDLILEKLD